MFTSPSSLPAPLRTRTLEDAGWREQLGRMALISGGSLCVAVGFVFFLFPPIPLGTPLLAIGLAMLMRSSTTFKRWVLVRTRRRPRIHRFLRKVAGRP